VARYVPLSAAPPSVWGVQTGLNADEEEKVKERVIEVGNEC